VPGCIIGRGKRLKPLRVAGLSAVGLLLIICWASTSLESALGEDTTGPVRLDIEVPVAVYANEPFSITLQATNDSYVWPLAFGYLYVDKVLQVTFEIYFDTSSVWESPISMILTAGWHTLNFTVEYTDTDVWTATVEKSIFVQTRLPSYTVVWLQKPEPDEPIRAGKLIRFRFSIQDASGSFVQSDKVRIIVEGTDVEATCGRKSGSIRINTDREYYRWYWKTARDLPAGVYSVIVFLEGANLSGNSIQITIVS